MTEGNGKLDVLIEQVGRLTEGLTEIRGLVREQLAVAHAQADSISRLAETTERQAETTERQTIVSERLAATVERQSQMLEILMNEKVKSAL